MPCDPALCMLFLYISKPWWWHLGVFNGGGIWGCYSILQRSLWKSVSHFIPSFFFFLDWEVTHAPNGSWTHYLTFHPIIVHSLHGCELDWPSSSFWQSTVSHIKACCAIYTMAYILWYFFPIINHYNKSDARPVFNYLAIIVLFPCNHC